MTRLDRCLGRKLRAPLYLTVLAGIFWAAPAAAQPATFVIDPVRSLAWWQLDPHYGHLWATTCPKDPSWQPGEGHSAGYYINYKSRPKIRTTKESESRVPLFPRDTVRANCRRSVTGSFTTSDARRFADMKGTVTVRVDSITNGSDSRDAFADKYVYSSARYPTVDFRVDSVRAVSMSGDTVNAIAIGTFVLRGVEKPTRVQVQGVHEESGLRVRGLFAMPAKELQDRYEVSKVALGLGVGLKLWDTLFMGFDLILSQRASSASP
jgi:hypothetical protein